MTDIDPDRLRELIAFATRDGALRTVMTDSESASGVALACTAQDHPEGYEYYVRECCDDSAVELWHQMDAELFVAATTAIPALLNERDQLRARVAELEAAQREQQPEVSGTNPRPGHGPGVPGAMHLEAFGQSIADAFGDCPYHVGSSATSKTWRDVDVRLILADDRFHALFPGFANAHHIDAWWSLLCAALSELGRARTGLPVDFQIQSMTEANEKHSGVRNPLFLIHSREDHRPAMQAKSEQELAR